MQGGARKPPSLTDVNASGARRASDVVPSVRTVPGFQLLRVVAQGGTGEVWEAEQHATGAHLAVKLIHRGERWLERRLWREGRVLRHLKHHPGIVRVYGMSKASDGTPALIMELLAGESLAELLRREHRLPLEVVARIMLPVVRALAHAHEHGIVHCRVQPKKVFLCTSDGVKLLDFGVAKFTHGSERDVIGVDHRIDIYRLGLVMYEALTGIVPMPAMDVASWMELLVTPAVPSLREAAPALPTDIHQLIDRMVLRDRAAQLDDLGEAIEVLSRYDDEEPAA